MFSFALKIKTKLSIPQRPTGLVPPALPPPTSFPPSLFVTGVSLHLECCPPILLPDLPSQSTDVVKKRLCLLIFLSHPCPSLSCSHVLGSIVLTMRVFTAAQMLLSQAVVSGATLHCSAWASHCGGFSCCGARALGSQAQQLAAVRLRCSAACEIFLDQGSNSCSLRWQVGSSLLDHQGNR